MNTEQLFQAMSEIDEELIAEAADPLAAKASATRKKTYRFGKIAAAAAAAAVAVMILLPNLSMSIAYAWEKLPVLSTIVDVVVWRDYQEKDGGYEADIRVPQVQVETAESEASIADRMQQSADEINASVEELTDRIIREFEAARAQDPQLEGADSIHVGHETVTDTAHYFSLRLWVTEIMGSGYEQNYYYTIDRRSGQLVTLAGLFSDDGYVQTISAEIRRQMAEQMAADENVLYWLDDTEVPEWNFKEIAADQSFYINENGRLVICFNEGDVAPMYMGCVTFEMPAQIWSDTE